MYDMIQNHSAILFHDSATVYKELAKLDLKQCKSYELMTIEDGVLPQCVVKAPVGVYDYNFRLFEEKKVCSKLSASS